MSIESHLRLSVLRTALLHLLRNGGRFPQRTARNIRELLIGFHYNGNCCTFSAEDLITQIECSSKEECMEWIIKRLS